MRYSALLHAWEAQTASLSHVTPDTVISRLFSNFTNTLRRTGDAGFVLGSFKATASLTEHMITGAGVTAIREVMNGGSYFSPAVAREIVEQVRSPRNESPDPFTLLSAREREVLQRIAEGLSAKEVATDLSISTKTVEAHRTSLMRKLNVRKATELVRYALRHGLIEP